MRHFVPIALLVIAALLLYGTPADSPILGLDHGRFAQAALAGVLILWLLLGGPWRLRRADIGRALGGAATWAALMIGLTGLYAYRFEFTDIADRVIAELNPSDVQVGQIGRAHV